MSCFFMASCLVVFGCFGVMASGVSVMLGGGLMMFSCFLGHRNISLIGIVITAVAGSTQPIRLLPYRPSNERFGFIRCSDEARPSELVDRDEPFGLVNRGLIRYRAQYVLIPPDLLVDLNALVAHTGHSIPSTLPGIDERVTVLFQDVSVVGHRNATIGEQCELFRRWTQSIVYTVLQTASPTGCLTDDNITNKRGVTFSKGNAILTALRRSTKPWMRHVRSNNDLNAACFLLL